LQSHPTSHTATSSSLTKMDHISTLPTEIAIHIVGSMRLPDMLTMRLVSRRWNDLITSPSSQRAIARHYLDQGFLPALVLKLYPPPSNPDLEYLAGIWYRFDISCQLVSLLIQNTLATYPRRHRHEQGSNCTWQSNGGSSKFCSTAVVLDLERLHSRQNATAQTYAARCPAAAFTAFHFLEEYRQRIEASSFSSSLSNGVNDNHNQNHNRDVCAILARYGDENIYLLQGIHHFGILLPGIIDRVLSHGDHLPTSTPRATASQRNNMDTFMSSRFQMPERVKLHLLWLGGIPAVLKAMRRAAEDGDNGRRAVYEWHRGLSEHLKWFQVTHAGQEWDIWWEEAGSAVVATTTTTTTAATKAGAVAGASGKSAEGSKIQEKEEKKVGLFKHPRPGDGFPSIAPGLENRPMATTLRVGWAACSRTELKKRHPGGDASMLRRGIKGDGGSWMRSGLAKPLEDFFKGSHFEEMLREPIWKV